jgi:thiol-disulfide isomerase/thioredoxin
MRALAILFAAGCASAPHAPGPAPLARVIDVAREVHRPVVVLFYATWCGPCHVLLQRVLTDHRVQAELDQIVFVAYDVDTTDGKEAAERCAVRGIPTLVAVDRDGNVVARHEGSGTTIEQVVQLAHTITAPLPAASR